MNKKSTIQSNQNYTPTLLPLKMSLISRKTKNILPTISSQLNESTYLVHTAKEEMPHFPGCFNSMEAYDRKLCSERKLLSFLKRNIQYPEAAKIQRLSGIVYIQFVVKEDGRISDAQIVKDIGMGCGEEALRVVRTMPNWIPGKQGGIPISTRFNLPVRFMNN